LYQPTVRNSMAWDGGSTMRSDWNFDTIKTSSVMGTLRSMAKDLVVVHHNDLEDDEGYEEEIHSGNFSIDTTASVAGSDPIQQHGAIGTNPAGSHSTVVIKSSTVSGMPSPSSEKDMATLLAMKDDSSEETTVADDSPSSPPLGAPPAYTGSMRQSRRSSYAARQSTHGTVMREADVGNGMNTLRPIKKVDAAGSLRLSSEFVGSIRSREGSTSNSAPSSPTIHKRITSEMGKAGASMIDDIVIPTIEKVSALRSLDSNLSHTFLRLFEMIWMLGKLNH
jgi:serine/threonine-protein kinase 24/25/MST4